MLSLPPAHRSHVTAYASSLLRQPASDIGHLDICPRSIRPDLEHRVFLALLDQLDHRPGPFVSLHDIDYRHSTMSGALDAPLGFPPPGASSVFRAFHKLAQCRQLNRKHLLTAHHMLCPDVAAAGALRQRGVCHIRCPLTGAVTYTAPDARQLPSLLDDMIDGLNAVDATGHTPFVALLQWLLIHPFVDGNGRTARLLFAALCWRHAYRHPAFLLALAVLYRHQATWLRAGSMAITAHGDASTYIERCDAALRIGLDLWNSHLSSLESDDLNDATIRAIERLWSHATHA